MKPRLMKLLSFACCCFLGLGTIMRFRGISLFFYGEPPFPKE